jgi:hypothetical protein
MAVDNITFCVSCFGFDKTVYRHAAGLNKEMFHTDNLIIQKIMCWASL